MGIILPSLFPPEFLIMRHIFWWTATREEIKHPLQFLELRIIIQRNQVSKK